MTAAGVNVISWTVRAPIIVLMRFTPGLLALFFATLANAQESEPCSISRSEVTLGPLSGHRIDSVAVATSSPNLGRRGRAIAKMHVRTRPEIIRRELLFAAGDTVDTLLVAESLRRLRKLQFLENAHVEAEKCSTPVGESLALKVVTRDAWTTRPDIKAGGSSPRIGLTERDLLGTGRTVSLSLVSHNRSLGAGISTMDTFGFGTGFEPAPNISATTREPCARSPSRGARRASPIAGARSSISGTSTTSRNSQPANRSSGPEPT